MTGIGFHRGVAGFGTVLGGRDGVKGNTTNGRRDKSGSPLAIQAPDRACLSPCRSVGARAAPVDSFNDFNANSGTVRLSWRELPA